MTTTITTRVSGTVTENATQRVAAFGDGRYFGQRYFAARYFKARYFRGGRANNATVRVSGTPTANHTTRVTGL